MDHDVSLVLPDPAIHTRRDALALSSTPASTAGDPAIFDEWLDRLRAFAAGVA